MFQDHGDDIVVRFSCLAVPQELIHFFPWCGCVRLIGKLLQPGMGKGRRIEFGKWRCSRECAQIHGGNKTGGVGQILTAFVRLDGTFK
ncbi:hypothetical protein C2W62_10295 [Candidatus Entotheonella serta]|nr:hypothetical protein C2W62_10295 [Candidatus Entotheonella serta]